MAELGIYNGERIQGVRGRNPVLYRQIVNEPNVESAEIEDYDVVEPEEDYPKIIRIPLESDPLRLKIREWRLINNRVIKGEPVFLSFAEAKKYQQERKKAKESLTRVNENYGNGGIDDSQKHLDSILGL